MEDALSKEIGSNTPYGECSAIAKCVYEGYRQNKESY